MTAPAAPTPLKLGPGWLRFGPTATVKDASCYVNSATVNPAMTVGESSWKLCGVEVVGPTDVAGTLDVNLDLDATAGGVFEYLTKAVGTVVEFAFLPHGTRDGTTGVVTPGTGDLEARGHIVVPPPPFGGDTYGDVMTFDLSATLAGTVVDYYRDAVKSFSLPLGPITAAPAP